MRRENSSDEHSPLRHIHHMKNGSSYQVEDWVELTTLGKSWVPKIREIDSAEKADDGSNDAPREHIQARPGRPFARPRVRGPWPRR